MARSLTYENIVDEVLNAAPGFRPQLEIHLTNNDGLLRHVLFGDLTRYVIEKYRAAEHGDRVAGDDFERVLSLLEDALTKSCDESLHTLVVTSFLENLWQADDDYASLTKTLGAGLRAALAQLDD